MTFTSPGPATGESNRFATRLRDCMTIRGISQASVARALGVSKNSVNNWVQGRGLPNAVHTVAIAELLGVTAENLVHGAGPTKTVGSDPILRRLADPELAGVLAALAAAAPELQRLVTDAGRLLGDRKS